MIQDRWPRGWIQASAIRINLPRSFEVVTDSCPSRPKWVYQEECWIDPKNSDRVVYRQKNNKGEEYFISRNAGAKTYGVYDSVEAAFAAIDVPYQKLLEVTDIKRRNWKSDILSIRDLFPDTVGPFDCLDAPADYETSVTHQVRKPISGGESHFVFRIRRKNPPPGVPGWFYARVGPHAAKEIADFINQNLEDKPE